MDAGLSNGGFLGVARKLWNTDGAAALPHSEVETLDFYKHINQDLMEPRRMKQLLVWCGTRALPEKPSGGAENVHAVLAGMLREKYDEVKTG